MERFFILLILAGLSVSGVAQKSMWLIAGQSNASWRVIEDFDEIL